MTDIPNDTNITDDTDAT